MYIQMQLPEASSLQATSDAAREVEAVLKGRRFGQLHLDVHVSLVLVRQEAGGQHLPKEDTSDAKCGDCHQGQRTFPNQPAARAHVQIATGRKHAIEPGEESRQRPMTLFLGPEKQSPKRRAQSEGVEG